MHKKTLAAETLLSPRDHNELTLQHVWAYEIDKVRIPTGKASDWLEKIPPTLETLWTVVVHVNSANTAGLTTISCPVTEE